MSKVILIEPYGAGVSFAPDASKKGNQAPPYAIESLGGYLVEKGQGKIDVSLIHQRSYVKKEVGLEFKDENETISITDEDITAIIMEQKKAAKNGEPVIVGIRAVTPLYLRALEIAQKIKEVMPDVKIIVGGYYASEVKEKVFEGEVYQKRQQNLRESLGNQKKQLIDCFAVGEGEQTLLEVVNAFDEKKDLKTIKGLAYFDEQSGKGKFTGTRERLIGEGDEKKFNLHLPEAKREVRIPVRDKDGNFIESKIIPSFPGCTQFFTFPASDEIKEMQINYGRGCPYQCNFCSSPEIWGKTVVFRSPKEVVDEMVKYNTEHGINFAYFADLTFNHNIGRLEAICDEMKSRKRDDGTNIFGGEGKENLHWFQLAEAFNVSRLGIDKTKEIMKTMKDAGCSKIGIGVEGFTPEDMTEMKKKNETPVDRAANILLSLKLASDQGIFTRGFLLWGAKGQNKETKNRVKALLGAEVPEVIFENIEELKKVLEVIYYNDEFKNISDPKELSRKVVDLLKDESIFSAEELQKKTRLFEIDHLRIAPETPYYSTEVGSSEKLRFFEYYKDDKTGQFLLDKTGCRIPKLLFKDDQAEIVIKSNKKGDVEYGVTENGKFRVLTSEEMKNVEKKVESLDITFKEAIDSGMDYITEIFDQESATIESELSMEDITDFPKKELVEYFYTMDGFKHSMQRKIKNFPYLRETCIDWQNFIGKALKKEINWEINQEPQETKNEFKPKMR